MDVFAVTYTNSRSVNPLEATVEVLIGAEQERIEVRNSDLLARLLTFQKRNQFFSLPVCQDDRVVYRVGSAFLGPDPRSFRRPR